MPRALVLVLAAFALTACSGGETEPQTEGQETGATGATAGTGATGATGGPDAAGYGSFGGAVSIDTSAAEAAGLEAALYSCDGVEGTWTYVLRGGPVNFDIDETFSMDGGDGTLVISDEFSVGGVNVSFTDTIELVIGGTRTRPTMRATSIQVDVEGNIPGLSDELFESLFTENEELPIRRGASEC